MDPRPNPTPDPADATAEPDTTALAPLPGEAGIPTLAPPRRQPWSRKGLLAAGLLMLLLVALAAYGIQHLGFGHKKPGENDADSINRRPAAASNEPRRLDMATPAGTADAASTAAPALPRIPALIPTADEMAEPIGVRRTGQGVAPSSGAAGISPEDAPVLLVSAQPGAGLGRGLAQGGEGSAGHSTAAGNPDPAPAPIDDARRNLQAYQRQLQGLLDNLTRSAATATGNPAAPALLGGLPGLASGAAGALPPTGAPAGGSLFGGQLQGSATPRVVAAHLGQRSLTLPKGTAFTCALKTKVISATSGLVGCQVQRNVFSDDGRVLLIERGSHLDGEYRISSVRPGTVRIPVLWTRIRTPLGVTVDIDSPGTGPLGESGIDGYVDNRWGERIGAAMLLSLIDDSVKLIIQNQARDSEGDTIVLPSSTANTSKLAEKVLDSTINIPPLIYQNQGGIVGIYVARDVDFSSVYALQAVAR